MFFITTVLLIVIAVLLFCLIIFIHELGHFLTAKLCGIKVNEFAIGMGPRLLKFGKKETVYSLRAFPIGGFCAMEGEDQSSDNPRAFGNKPVWKRILVVAAGGIMNILLGFVLMFICLVQQPYYPSTTINGFRENSALEEAGVQVGDSFHSIDGYRIYTLQDITFALATCDPASVDFVMTRNGEKVTLSDVSLHSHLDGDRVAVTYDFTVQAIPKTFGSLMSQTFSTTVANVRSVWGSLVGIITGRIPINSLAGPVGTASAVSQAASSGLSSGFGAAVNNILLVMIIITVNLGIVNLLPLPALDGGRLVFLIIEGIRRKPINPKYEGWIHAAGFALLIGFMILISIKDIIGLF